MYAITVYQTGPFQVDNQLYSDGRFDFGVLLKTKHKYDDDVYLTPEASLQSDVCFQFVLGLEMDDDIGANIAYVQLKMKDTEVFVEDQFLYEILHRMRSYAPASQRISRPTITSQRLPSVVRAQMNLLRSPVGMRNLEIHGFAILASIHASLKVYIAVDRTLLSFNQFETGPVFASSKQIIEALTMHFTSGALFKAGLCTLGNKN